MSTAVNSREEFENIINSLSVLILHFGRIQANEEYFPSRGPDQMDDIIMRNKDNVKKLRDVRLTVEDIYAGTV